MTQAQLAAVAKLILAAKHLAVEHIEVLNEAGVDFKQSVAVRKIFDAIREVEGRPTGAPGVRR